MKGLGTDKLLPEGKRRETTLDLTQEAKESPKGGSEGGHGLADSPVISEAGDSDGLKPTQDAPDAKDGSKEKEKKDEKKQQQIPEEPKKSHKDEIEKQAEVDANYKRKVMEEVTTLARKMSREEIEDEKKIDKKHEKSKKPDRGAFSPILKPSPAAKSPDNHKSRSDSRKKRDRERDKKSKIRDEINGTPRKQQQQDDENNSHERPQRSRARTPGQEHNRRVGDDNDELILAMLRENRERDRQDRDGGAQMVPRSGRHIRAPAFDELEHPRARRGGMSHELIRGSRGGEQRESPDRVGKSARSHKKISDPRNDGSKTAPVASGQHPVSTASSEDKSYFSSRRRSQLTIIVLAFSLLIALIVIIIQAAFISGKCSLTNPRSS